MRKLLALFLVSFAALATPAFAGSHTWVDGRFYQASLSYYTASRGDMVVTFEDQLPWGAKVEVHYGLGGIETRSDGRNYEVNWQDQATIGAYAVGPYTWSAGIDKALHTRGQPRYYTKLQFVIVVTLPDGVRYYEKGGESEQGYFEAALPHPGTIPAVDRDHANWVRLPLRVIHR